MHVIATSNSHSMRGRQCRAMSATRADTTRRQWRSFGLEQCEAAFQENETDETVLAGLTPEGPLLSLAADGGLIGRGL
jgi:hypothetical protein